MGVIFVASLTCRRNNNQYTLAIMFVLCKIVYHSQLSTQIAKDSKIDTIMRQSTLWLVSHNNTLRLPLIALVIVLLIRLTSALPEYSDGQNDNIILNISVTGSRPRNLRSLPSSSLSDKSVSVGRDSTRTSYNIEVNHNISNETEAEVPDEYLRLVGGKPVVTKDYRSYGRSAGNGICGATLFHPEFMLTAAHCATHFKGKGVYISGLKFDGSDSIFRQVKEEYPHPSFSTKTLQNDVMVIQLSTPAPSDVPLQRLNYDTTKILIDENVTVVGFGHTKENGALSPTLMEVQVKVLDTSTNCRNYWKRLGYPVDAKKQLCIGDLRGGKDSCNGDSGGPALHTTYFRTTYINYQVGIVSYGLGCARANSPPVYTRVSAYTSFIDEIVCKHAANKPVRCQLTEKCACPPTTLMCLLQNACK